MALRMIESFDWLDYGDYIVYKPGWVNAGGISSTFGRNARSLAGTNTNQGSYYVCGVSSQTWTAGFAYNTNVWTGSANPMFQARDDNHVVHLGINLKSSGGNVLEIRRGAAGTVLATSTTQLTANNWHYIEFKFTISDTVGSLYMQINGISETLTFATGVNGSQDTRNGGLESARIFYYNGTSSGNTHYWDDAYLCDGEDGTATQGRANNSFLGDCAVKMILPSGNGNSSQFVGSDGDSTNNYLLVDEVPFNTADYVGSPTVGNKDTYQFSDLPSASGTVYAVVPIPMLGKSNAGVRKAASVARLSATEVDGSDRTLTASPFIYPEYMYAKPGGGTWTVSDVNSAEFGVKVTA